MLFIQVAADIERVSTLVYQLQIGTYSMNAVESSQADSQPGQRHTPNRKSGCVHGVADDGVDEDDDGAVDFAVLASYSFVSMLNARWLQRFSSWQLFDAFAESLSRSTCDGLARDCKTPANFK